MGGTATRILTLSMTLALLAGCGSTAATTASSRNIAIGAGKRFLARPVEGGNLVIGTTQEPDTLNPNITQLVTATDPSPASWKA